MRNGGGVEVLVGHLAQLLNLPMRRTTFNSVHRSLGPSLLLLQYVLTAQFFLGRTPCEDGSLRSHAHHI